MSAPDQHVKAIVCDFLGTSGLTFEEVEVAAMKTPDLLVNRGLPDATLIELKTKGDDPIAMEELNSELDGGGIVSRNQQTDYWNRIDAIISYGVKQMRDIDPDRLLLRVIWIHCTGLDAALAEMRLKATLYGTQKLFCMKRPNIVTCHYFWNSSFFKHRYDLDGVVISRGEQAQLNLNDHSIRFGAILDSRLCQAFDTAVYHPKQYSDDADFMYHDSDMPRTDEKSTLDYLRKKYDLDEIQTINMGMHSGMMRVQKG